MQENRKTRRKIQDGSAEKLGHRSSLESRNVYLGLRGVYKKGGGDNPT